MKRLRITYLLMMAIALAATSIATYARQDSTEAIKTHGEQIVDRLAAGQMAQVVAEFDPRMAAALSEEQLRSSWNTVVGQAGAFKQRTAARGENRGALGIAVVTCQFERGVVDVQVVFNETGKIAGLQMRPATTPVVYTLPAYAVPAMYTEREVTVGADGWPLPGTLTQPVRNALVPAVVLVHGSGPNDRDETIGANKPFRDLAVGLASAGVAVLRYDKRTRQHAARVNGIPGFTVKDEVVDDVLAAVAFLRTQPAIDGKRIVVVGHSLGGMLIPRIGAADAGLAGLVVMAGAVTPLDQAILKQLQYLAEADGTVSPAEQSQIDQQKAVLAPVATLTEADRTRPGAIAGAPASYWLDLRGWNPPVAARALTQPLLVLQGERDYQVTMSDFAAWKTALGARPKTTLKSYPGLNHVFITGTGPSLPQEYQVAGHVSADVIRDIAEWTQALPPAQAVAAATR